MQSADTCNWQTPFPPYMPANRNVLCRAVINDLGHKKSVYFQSGHRCKHGNCLKTARKLIKFVLATLIVTSATSGIPNTVK
jgi:hypothetical protein